jgi:hypothetical protein
VAASWWPPALRYEPYADTAESPNVVVDGSANPSTVLTLSHWPQAPCPPALRRDLSAESALDYLGHASLHGRAERVTNNHFDQDGLMSVYALVEPEAALARADRVVEVARAGDFAVTTSRHAARVSMAVASCTHPERSPLGADALVGPADVMTARLYLDLLPRVSGWLDDPATCAALWQDEDAQLQADQELMASGRVTVDEVPELDLTVVTLPESYSSSGGHRFGQMWSDLVHPMALHAAIDGMAVLLVRGGDVELRYRYESWVQFQSHPVRPRVDLSPLAAELTDLEPGHVRWGFDGVGALTPALHLEDGATTGLEPDDIRRRVEHALRTSPPAWDPYV